MKTLAIIIVTFCAASSFAQPIRFLKNSKLPKQLQALVSETLAYNCPGLVKSKWEINEEKTVSSKDTGNYLSEYKTYATITEYDSDGYHPTYSSMYILTSIYKNEKPMVSIRSNGICNTIDD